MNKIPEILKLLQQMVHEAGWVPTLLIMLTFWGIIATCLYALHKRDKTLERAFNSTIDSKEKEIQRLAADNREWRDKFFQKEGFSPKVLQAAVASPTALAAVKNDKPEGS